MNQLALLDSAGRPTLAAALVARDEAMQRVLDHAEEIKDDWGRLAYRFVVNFAHANYEFICQDIVRAFNDSGDTRPHTDKAWGPVVKRAINVGCIVFIGYDKAPHRHASPCPRYRSKIFRGEGA